MCGICGYRSLPPVPLEKMVAVMTHRGPDDSGTFRSADVGLGHRRLAVIDPTGGRQPMTSQDGRVTLVYNGEIYNYLELKSLLARNGTRFRTSSDTEVLLEMYMRHGKGMLDHLNGEFAFVLYDARNNTLFGARDRLGIRPFYYSFTKDGFFFASEIKALFETGKIRPAVHPPAVDLYFTYRYIPGAQTIYRDIRKVPPGRAFEQTGDSPPRFWTYWDIPEETRPMGLDAAVEEFSSILSDSVRHRLLSDVPLGVFLSGGVDSSTILAVMSELGHRPIRSFTVGFDSPGDESAEAEESARHFGCDHRGFTLPADSFEALPKIVWHMDEPFADPILIPTYFLSRIASRDVKVVLTGDGADEGQMGYVHQESLSVALAMGRHLPSALMRIARRIVPRLPVRLLDRAFHYPSSMGLAGRERLGELIGALHSPGRAYQSFASLFTSEERDRLYGPILAAGKSQAEEEHHRPLVARLDASRSPIGEIYRHDLKHWLPDNILNKQDRMSMASSVEGRVPFLDHRIVEFEAALPRRLKIRMGRGKRLLRTLYDRRYSFRGRNRMRKKAFFMPLDGAFAAPFRALAGEYLDPATIDESLLDRSEVARIVREADRSPLVGHKKVMSLVMFQIWRKVFRAEWPA